MSQLNTTTPFTFLGHIKCIPVSKLTSIDQSTSSSALTVSLQPGSTRSMVLDPAPQTRQSASPVLTLTSTDSLSQKRVVKRRASQSSCRSKFPTKLYELVTKCTSGAIAWSADGRSVMIKYSLFRNEYLQSVFKTANISSFVRQLNLYGFRKVTVSTRRPRTAPSDSHTFERPGFTRDNPDLVSITRSASTTCGKSKFLLVTHTRN